MIRVSRSTLRLVRKRTWTILVAVTAIAAVGVTAAVAGSAGRDGPAAKSKAAKKARTTKATTTTGGVSGVQVSEPNAGSYWTPERMKEAQPLERTVPGGSTTSAPSSPSPRTAVEPRSSKAKTNTKSTSGAKAKRTTTSQSQAGNEGVSGHDVTEDAASYWTPELMDSAGPMERSVPGGDPPDESSDPLAPIVSP